MQTQGPYVLILVSFCL